jgi:hypothetical protein
MVTPSARAASISASSCSSSFCNAIVSALICGPRAPGGMPRSAIVSVACAGKKSVIGCLNSHTSAAHSDRFDSSWRFASPGHSTLAEAKPPPRTISILGPPRAAICSIDLGDDLLLRRFEHRGRLLDAGDFVPRMHRGGAGAIDRGLPRLAVAAIGDHVGVLEDRAGADRAEPELLAPGTDRLQQCFGAVKSLRPGSPLGVDRRDRAGGGLDFLDEPAVAGRAGVRGGDGGLGDHQRPAGVLPGQGGEQAAAVVDLALQSGKPGACPRRQQFGERGHAGVPFQAFSSAATESFQAVLGSAFGSF